MQTTAQTPTPAAQPRAWLLVGFILSCCVGMILTGWQLEQSRPKNDLALDDQPLYGSDQATRRMSLAFNGLAADWYWMRTLQYVGRRVLRAQETGESLQLDDLRNLNLRLLKPLLQRTTTLDPQFVAAYQYGGVILPAVDQDAAIQLLRQGIANNPNEWRLYNLLGYIYWKRQDYPNASATYSAGGKIPGAPEWMPAMSARMLSVGGNRDTAREIYQRLYEESDDESIRNMAEQRLAEVDSFDEKDAIRLALKAFQTRANRCPATWRELNPELRAARLPKGQTLVLNAEGAPVDPSNAAYILTKNGCDVGLGPQTKVPYQE